MIRPIKQVFTKRVTVVTIAIIIAFAAVWLRSESVEHDIMLFGRFGRICGVSIARGRILVFATDIRAGSARAWTVLHESMALQQADDGEYFANNGIIWGLGIWAAMGEGGSFYFVHDGYELGSFALIRFPLWVCAVPIVGFVAVRTAKVLRMEARRRRGVCVGCGYDLRGGHERCPECGLESYGIRPRAAGLKGG